MDPRTAFRAPSGLCRTVRRPPDDERGTALIEAAFVIPVLVVIVLGIMEFGLVFASTSTATQASQAPGPAGRP